MKIHPLKTERNARLLKEALRRDPMCVTGKHAVSVFRTARKSHKGEIGTYSGTVVVFKKVAVPVTEEFVIAVLRIPRGTLVRRPTSKYRWHSAKCRAAKVECLGFLQLNRAQLCRKEITHAKPIRIFYTSMEYRIGKACIPDGFDQRAGVECAKGIHFFETLTEARAY